MRTLLLFCFICSTFTGGAQVSAGVAYKQKAFTLIRFLEKNHYQPKVWNDSASMMLFDKWIEKLDDEKLFFTKSDLLALNPYRSKLDDELLGKEWKFFPASIQIYKSRLLVVDSVIRSLLSKPLDFTKPDELQWPNADHAANEQDLIKRWRGYLKWEILDRISDRLQEEKKLSGSDQPAQFAQMETDARIYVLKHETGNIKNILNTPAEFMSTMEEDFLNSIAWCYDPHTVYMNIGEKKEFETAMSASEYSAGFEVDENEKGDKVISFLQPGGSAWRSGLLHNGDVLLKIKMSGVEKDVTEFTPGQIEMLLIGSSEADVEVTVQTAAGEQKTVKLIKEKITDEESIVKSYVLRGNKNVGYISLPGFYTRDVETMNEIDNKNDGCANDVSKEIVKLKKDSITGLILDLRYNGGGSMWEAMQLAGIFIDIGPVASVKDKSGKAILLKDPNRGTIYDGPLIVLVNGASASASEFVSAALQDYNRAIIVGGNTYGKGTAQGILPLDTGIISVNKNYTDFVKVTGQKFYRINGSTAQWKGVIPDIELPDLYSNEAYKERSNKSALPADINKTWPYQSLPPVAFQGLRTASSKRIEDSEYFKTINAFSILIHQYQKARIIPLTWKGFVGHYMQIKEMFRLISDDKEAKTTLNVTNNAFDRERINVSTIRSKEINDTYLEKVKADNTIEEAYLIMMDWQVKK